MPHREQEGVMKARTPYLKPLSASTMALLVILVAGYQMSDRASAQDLPPTDPVLDAVQQVQRSIVGLTVNLGALQSGLDVTLAPIAVNFRWTPPVNATLDRVGCVVVNVSGVQKTVHIELRRGDGSNFAEETADVEPGEVQGVDSQTGQSGAFQCRFTVIGGTRADIRGSLWGNGIGFSRTTPGGEFWFQPSYFVPAE
jgi:hypothetical protein